MYEYKCRECGRLYDHVISAAKYATTDKPVCCDLLMRRVYSAPSIRFDQYSDPHYNPTVGRPISSKREMLNAVKELEAEESERTGIDHHYALQDLRDWKSLGVTEDIFDAQRKNALEQGVSDPKFFK